MPCRTCHNDNHPLSQKLDPRLGGMSPVTSRVPASITILSDGISIVAASPIIDRTTSNNASDTILIFVGFQ